MNELMDLLNKYSFVEILCLFVTAFVAGKWVIGQISGVKHWWIDKLKSYRTEENAKDEKEEKTEDRFKDIEDKLGTDYVRIQKAESHLYTMTEQLKELKDEIEILKDMLINLKLETMRARILDFAPLAIDLTHMQSREKYTEIYKVHGDYMKLIEQTGKDNNYETYNFDLIKKSYEQRSINKLFTEDCYIAPSTIMNKNSKDEKEE